MMFFESFSNIMQKHKQLSKHLQTITVEATFYKFIVEKVNRLRPDIKHFKHYSLTY